METIFKDKNNLPGTLIDTLYSTQNYWGEYEYETNLKKLIKQLSETNPFSILIFYERPEHKLSKKKTKELNPKIPEYILRGGPGYEQFYIIPEIKDKRRGNSHGTLYRETQSIYAAAFSEISKTKNIPTHILIKDKDHIVKHVMSHDKLIIYPNDVDNRELIQNTSTTYYNKDLEGIIKEIVVKFP